MHDMNHYQQRVPEAGEDFRVADRLEIIDLVYRSMTAVDLGDRETLRACFADRMIWDLSGNPAKFTGTAVDDGPQEVDADVFVNNAMAAFGAAPENVFRFRQHCVNNPIVTFLSGDSATSMSYLRDYAHVRTTHADGTVTATNSILGGIYHHDFSRVGDRWRISALRLRVHAYDPAMFAGRK